jgi:uncharacterized membrane protein
MPIQQKTDQQKTGRLAFIDWTRGLAALIMLQGHTFHSFLKNDLRSQGPYMFSQMLGGLPPAIFLLLTGITFAFLMDSQEKKQATGWQKIIAALKRSRYLFLIAFLFRLQLYVFGFPTSPADQILRVDILNCMGFAMLVLTPMALFTTAERIRVCAVAGIAIAALAPVISMIDVSGVPWFLRAYVVPDSNYFAFFPWASFLAFGMAAGSILRVIKPEDMHRLMLWTMMIGLGVIYLAHYVSNLPYSIYAKSDFWLNSPGLILIKLGLVLCLLAIAYLWVHFGAIGRWSILRQFGTTSLIVYWVHIELVYGRWFGAWKESMSVAQVLLYTTLLTVLMMFVSLGQTRFQAIKAWFTPAVAPGVSRASGD